MCLFLGKINPVWPNWLKNEKTSLSIQTMILSHSQEREENQIALSLSLVKSNVLLIITEDNEKTYLGFSRT